MLREREVATRLLARRTGFAAAALALVAIIAAGLGLLAYSEERKANASYAAAKGAVGDFVTLITSGLRDSRGIEVATVQKVLSLVDERI